MSIHGVVVVVPIHLVVHFVIHLIHFVALSLTHLLYRITFKVESQHLFWIISTISSQLIGLVLGVIVHRVGVTVQGEGVTLGLTAATLLQVSADL